MGGTLVIAIFRSSGTNLKAIKITILGLFCIGSAFPAAGPSARSASARARAQAYTPVSLFQDEEVRQAPKASKPKISAKQEAEQLLDLRPSNNDSDFLGTALSATTKACHWAGYVLHPEQFVTEKLIAPLVGTAVNTLAKKDSKKAVANLRELKDEVSHAIKSGELDGPTLHTFLGDFGRIDRDGCKDFLDATLIPVNENLTPSLNDLIKQFKTTEEVTMLFEELTPEISIYVAKQLTTTLRERIYWFTGDKSLCPEPGWPTQKEKYEGMANAVFSHPFFSNLLLPIIVGKAIKVIEPDEQKREKMLIAKVAGSMASNPELSISSAFVKNFSKAQGKPELYTAYKRANTARILTGTTSGTLMTLHRPNPKARGTDKTLSMINCFDVFKHELYDDAKKPYSFLASLVCMTAFKALSGLVLSSIFKTPSNMMPGLLSKIVTHSASQEITTGLHRAVESDRVRKYTDESRFANFLAKSIPNIWTENLKDKFEELAPGVILSGPAVVSGLLKQGTAISRPQKRKIS